MSLAADPVREIKVGFDILGNIKSYARGINFIACPSCSRQEFDVIKTINALETRLEDITTPMDVSVIGCVVNGPGEALVSDVGLAGSTKAVFTLQENGKDDLIMISWLISWSNVFVLKPLKHNSVLM